MTALLLRDFVLKSGICHTWEVCTVLEIRKDVSFAERQLLFGIVEVVYPEPSEWDEAAFGALKERELAALFAELSDYDRKAVFGENPYYRYFKKYKKTYPVLQQLESVLLKGRPFPSGRPLNEVAFLTELRTALAPYGVTLSLELPEAVIAQGADEAAGLSLEKLAPLVDRIYAATTADRVSALAEAIAAVSSGTDFVPELEVYTEALEGSFLIL